MWIIEESLPDLNNGKWFQIWSTETSDVKRKRTAAFCAEYLKLCVENEPELAKRRTNGLGAEYRMRYIVK